VQLLAGLAACTQFFFEALERVLQRFVHQPLVALVVSLVVLLRLRQILPTLLVLAGETEARRSQPRAAVLTHLLQPRRCLLEPLFEPLLTRPLHVLQHVGKGIGGLPREHVLPGLGHVAGAGFLTGETARQLLDLRVPVTGLGIEALQRRIRLRRGAAGQLRPPCQRLVPAGQAVGRRRATREARADTREPTTKTGCGRRLPTRAEHFAPLVPIAPGQQSQLLTVGNAAEASGGKPCRTKSVTAHQALQAFSRS